MRFDIDRFPFSRRGAYLSITGSPKGDRLILRNCRRLFGEEQFMDVFFTDETGNVLPFRTEANPSELKIEAGTGSAFFAIGVKEEIHVRAHALHVLLIPRKSWNFVVSDDTWRNHVITDHNYTTDTVVLEGSISGRTTTELVDGYHKQTYAEYRITPSSSGRLAFSIQVSPDEVVYRPSKVDYEDSVRESEADWREFLSTCPVVPDCYIDTAELLWYNLWSSVVAANGNFKYDAILMSKAGMCAVWSWDHCFNALAMMLGGHRKSALEQFFLLFEMQSPEGKLPDFINTEIHWRAAVKPPIHGWCFGILMDQMEISTEELEKAYHHLSDWTDWHFKYRDTDGDGIPEYIMGNDSGWDNSTLFDLGTNMETPDLPAYLYLQMKTLERIATRLGKANLALEWNIRANTLMETFLSHSYVDGVFVARKSRIHEFEPDPTSLLACMPIVCGDHLPAEISKKLVDRIETRFMTPHGLATECPSSTKYLSAGYWRGPVWAPTTLLAVDGLMRAGYRELALRVAGNFCDTVAASGAYENFDALTGDGLCDMGYTWTSSAALVLMTLLKKEIE